MSGILIVRLRSDINVRGDISDTMKMLNLERVNSATVLADTPEYRGMVRKVQDYCTFGPADAATIESLLKTRGQTHGGGALTDAALAACSDFKTVADYAAALAEGKASLGIRQVAEGSKTRNVWAVKPVMRLSPPKKGHEGIKHHFRSGGGLGDRGDNIGQLVTRMV